MTHRAKKTHMRVRSMEWMPISTAPRTTTVSVRIYTGQRHGRYVVIQEDGVPQFYPDYGHVAQSNPTERPLSERTPS